MRGVIAAALRDRTSRGDTMEGHERAVEDRHHHDQPGQQQRHRRAGRRAGRRDEAQPADREAEEQAARVAHEHPRRMEVVQQEPAAGPRQGGGEGRGRELAGRSEEQEVADRRDRRHPGGEAVHVVEEVERVRQRDQPQQRQQHVQPDHAGHRQAQAGRHDRGRDEELRRELGLRLERPQIVDQADRDAGGAAGHDHEQRRARIERHDGGERPGGDGDPAEQRNRPLVPAIAARPRDRPEAVRHWRAGEPGERGDDRGGGEGDQQEHRRRHLNVRLYTRAPRPASRRW